MKGKGSIQAFGDGSLPCIRATSRAKLPSAPLRVDNLRRNRLDRHAEDMLNRHLRPILN